MRPPVCGSTRIYERRLIPQQTGWLIFLAYVVCRTLYFEARVERSSHNNLVIGTTNTVDLLLSGLTDALAVHYAGTKEWRLTRRILPGTVLAGVCLLAFKFYEYYEHYEEALYPGAVRGVTAPVRD